MDNLGAKIRNQREAKGLTIADVSRMTKISVAVLHDIENGSFDRYEGDEAYVKMYLKKISAILDMNTEKVTEEYIHMTQEIQLEKLLEKQEVKEHQDSEKLEKSKAFVLKKPQLTRKPSVYQDKSHVKIIKIVIALILVCFIIGVVWYGIYATRLSSEAPKAQTPQTEVSTDGVNPSENNATTQETDTPQKDGVTFTRVGELDFRFKLPEGAKTFKFKIEIGNKAWVQLKVNGKAYDGFKAGVYEPIDDKTPETVELEFTVADFEKLELRNGYSAGHHYYINGQEVPLTTDDISYNAKTLVLTLEK